jgi:fructose-1-phosphate kinase PfkB-like protein
MFFAPAYPLEDVYDPTGAGDSFAGGLMGYIASQDEITDDVLRQATIVGCVMASFDVEKFSFEGMRGLDPQRIRDRFEMFQRLVNFDELRPLD